MRILHYSLGFPPYRTGGMTKFCIDIMQEQKRIGHEVSLLWSGEMKFHGKNIAIKNRGQYQGIESWEVVNPLPVSYDEGIINIDAFTAACDKSLYVNFLKQCKPDVIHIHTLMGLHSEFVEAAKELKIKTVFSVHDFFAICPKVTMFRKEEVCASAESCGECPQCNLTALSMNKIKILQSPLYRELKDSFISKKLRKQHRDQYLSGNAGLETESTERPERTVEDYKRLRSFYGQMISQVDVVHYNSSVTKMVFERFFAPANTKIISISHSDIRDNRRLKQFGNSLRLTYLGPQGGKGFFRLKAALDDLWLKRQDFSLNVFFTPTELSPYIKAHGRYTYADLECIFEETDVLVAPSIWYETFGYTVLEALSFGVPVIVSGNVGAKDIIPHGGGIIVNDKDDGALEKAISELTVGKLTAMNRSIVEEANIMTLSEMTKAIMEECY